VLAMRLVFIHLSSKYLTDQPWRVLHTEKLPTRDLSEGIRLAVA
jgi:hypothetical protein